MDIGEGMAALNSEAAINMLNERVDRRCDGVVSDWCDAGVLNLVNDIIGGHGGYTLKNGTSKITGFECNLDATGCMEWDAAGMTTSSYPTTVNSNLPAVRHAQADLLRQHRRARAQRHRVRQDRHDGRHRLGQLHGAVRRRVAAAALPVGRADLLGLWRDRLHQLFHPASCPDTSIYGTEFAEAWLKDCGHGIFSGSAAPAARG